MSSRITKFFVAYVGASAGMVQFLDWLVSRYLLSRSLVDLLLWLLLLMLPTVFLIAWYHGGSDEPTTRTHKRVIGVGVPLNLLLAAAVLFIVFHGKRLGATTEVVAVRDDNGAMVSRRVPKTEFRKKVALFNFESALNDPKLSWLRQGVPELLSNDLDQDPFLEVWSNYAFRTLYHRSHLNVDSVVPLAFARQAAESKHLEFFITGNVDKQGNDYRLRVTLHSTQSGHIVGEHEVAGGDLFALVDQLSPLLRRDLGLDAQHVEAAPDLPVSEITTRSLPALAELVLARNRQFEDDVAGATPHYEKAVALDPSFALAHVQLFFIYYQSHQTEKTQREMESTLANVYKLADSNRFYFNAIRYLLLGNVEKQKAVLTNWVTLHPQSSEARFELARYYDQRDDRDAALTAYQQALDIDPSETEILDKLVTLRKQRGEIDQALALYRHYLEQFPNDADAHLALAELYRDSGRFDEARQSYQRALSADPEDVSASIGVAALDFTQGDYDGATARLQKLLADTRLPRDRVAIHDELIRQYQQRGQMKKALEIFQTRQTEDAQFGMPMDMVRAQLYRVRLYVLAGHEDEARRAVAQAAADTAAMKENVNFQIAVEFGQLELDDALDDAAALAAHLKNVEATIQSFGVESLRTTALPYAARMQELNRDFAGALLSWQTLAKREPTLVRAAIAIGRCQRQLNNLEGARTQLKATLARFPAEAEAHYELALANRESNQSVALAEVNKALAIWAPADPDYKLAKAAKALSVTLTK